MHNISIPQLINTSKFRNLFEQMIKPEKMEEIAIGFHSGRGAPCKLRFSEIVMGSVFHEIQSDGTLAKHTRQITGKSISDAALSQRRQAMDLKIFELLTQQALTPQAVEAKHPEAFYQGLRLLGIDGSEFSVPNTEMIEEQMEKAASWKGETCFSKISLCMMSELGLHNPIGAAIRWGESEMNLAKKVFEILPAQSLLLGDRYYGVNKCIGQCIGLNQSKGSHFLFRVRSNLNSRLIEKLSDGSAIVEIERWEDNAKLRVREIRGKIGGRDGKKIEVRLWTDLVDEKKYPAMELLKLYAQRWEQEVMTDELKNKLGRGHLLKSQTLKTAVQEITAMLLAQALVVRVRMSIAEFVEAPTLRVSFRKTLVQIQALWLFLECGQDIISPKQAQALTQRCLQEVANQLSANRRKRSCPRAVRKPLGRYSKLKKNSYQNGEFQYQVISVS